MLQRKTFSIAEASEFLGLSMEELKETASLHLGKENVEILTYDELSSLLIDARIKVRAEKGNSSKYFEFLTKQESMNADVYLILVEGENEGNCSEPFMLEVRITDGSTDIIELVSTLRNLLIEREVDHPSIVTISRERIEVSDFFPEYEI